jgi:uncharacterized UPF0146 family protein
MLEVGAGDSFDVARALLDAGARVTVSDIDPKVMLAPPDLHARLLDLDHPDPHGWADIDLVYAVRLPEELQLAAARLADALGADLALRPLKDEWADIGPRRVVMWAQGWRMFAR